MNIENLNDESLSMHIELTEDGNLLCSDFEAEVMREVLEVFFSSKLSKTDLKILNHLMGKYWERNTSSIYLMTLDAFITKERLEISKPNLSRSLKALSENGIIEKVKERSNSGVELEYFFHTAFKTMKTLIGKI